MKKLRNKILVLLTVICLAFAATACGDDEKTPPKTYTGGEVMQNATENALSAENITITADADVYVAAYDKTIPADVTIKIKNQNGKMDAELTYSAQTTVAGQTVTIGNTYYYIDGILYMPSYDKDGNIIPNRLSTIMLNLPFEGLESSLSMIGGTDEETVKAENGVYTFDGEVDMRGALSILQSFVVTNKDKPLGDVIASFGMQGYTRAQLGNDLKALFNSESLAALADALDVLFEHFNLQITVKQLMNESFAEAGMTKNDLYQLFQQLLASSGASVPRPTAQQTAYDYLMSLMGAFSPDAILGMVQPGVTMANIKELVLGYVDNENCLFGLLWDMLAEKLDSVILPLAMFAGVNVQIMPPILSCDNLADYTVNTCKMSASVGIDAKTMRFSSLAFTVDTDIDYKEEKIKTYIDFEGEISYDQPVSVTIPADCTVWPCLQFDEISYEDLREGAPWEDTAILVNVFLGSCTETGAVITVCDANGEPVANHGVTFENGKLMIPGALLDAAYEGDTSYTIRLTLFYSASESFGITLEINPSQNVSVMPDVPLAA